MKRLTLLLLLLTLLLLFGCARSASTTATNPAPPPTATEQAPPPSDTAFRIYEDGAYRAALVLPNAPTKDETDAARLIKAALLSRAHAEIPTLTVAEAANADAVNLILIGNTGLPASDALYAALGPRSAAARIEGTCLAVGFVRAESGTAVVRDLVDLLLGSGEDITLSPVLSLSYHALPDLSELPSLTGEHETLSCGDGTVMQVGKSSVYTYSAYRDALDSIGFRLLSERVASGNRFAAYRGEKHYVYLYYTAYAEELRVITGPLDELVLTAYPSEAAASGSAYLASIPQPDNGQGYIVRLPDGRFLVQDGGYAGDDRVYAALRQLQPEGVIVIAAYFLSHPHADHQPAFIELAKTHRNDQGLVLERVILNYGDPARYDIDGTAGVETLSDEVEWLYDTMRTYRSGVPVLKAHTGQVIDFGCGATVEILYTAEDLFPREFPNINDSSMVIRVSIGDCSAILLADTCYLSGPILCDLWGEHLKSDIVQVAHHGQWPSVEELYHLIQGEIALYPAVLRRLSVDLLDSRWDGQCEAILSYAKDLYVSGDTLEILPLPCTVLNNKQQMIDRITEYQP